MFRNGVFGVLMVFDVRRSQSIESDALNAIEFCETEEMHDEVLKFTDVMRTLAAQGYIPAAAAFWVNEYRNAFQMGVTSNLHPVVVKPVLDLGPGLIQKYLLDFVRQTSGAGRCEMQPHRAGGFRFSLRYSFLVSLGQYAETANTVMQLVWYSIRVRPHSRQQGPLHIHCLRPQNPRLDIWSDVMPRYANVPTNHIMTFLTFNPSRARQSRDC